MMMQKSAIAIQKKRLVCSLVLLTIKMTKKQIISMKPLKRRWMNVGEQEERNAKLKKLRKNVKNDHLFKNSSLI